MKTVCITIVAALVAGSCDAHDMPATKPAEISNMKPRSHIPREQLQQMFDGIRQETKWNMDGDMLWGYFFVDHGVMRLKLVQRDLEAQAYRFVDLWEIENEGKQTGEFMLHVEKVETHSVDSLDTRNGEFDALAAKHGVKKYDGMDVGPVTSTTQPANTYAN